MRFSRRTVLQLLHSPFGAERRFAEADKSHPVALTVLCALARRFARACEFLAKRECPTSDVASGRSNCGRGHTARGATPPPVRKVQDLVERNGIRLYLPLLVPRGARVVSQNSSPSGAYLFSGDNERRRLTR